MARKRHILVIIISMLLFVSGVITFISLDILNKQTSPYYLASDNNTILLNGKDGASIELARGTLVNIKRKTVKIDDIEYYQFDYNDNTYYCLDSDLKLDRKDCVLETTLYTLRSHVLTSDYDTYKISGWLNKNEEVSVSGYHELLDDGSVDYYEINNIGYISSKYVSKQFYETGLDGSIYDDCYYGEGGNPSTIEYYSKEELNFENNKMPDKVKALYINAESICDAQDYIDIALECNINAFVVDIKDCYIDTQLAYNSDIALEYAPSTSNIPNDYDTYKENVKKLKDAGFYLIGRITAFKDDAFAKDNESEALTYDGELYRYGSVNWPRPIN